MEGATSSPLAHSVGFAKIKAGDPITDFVYASDIEELTPSVFAAELRNSVRQSKSNTAVVYVHGYMNDFTDAAFRTAQIAFDMKAKEYDVVPLMFSWPSDPGRLGADYKEARQRSQVSGYALAIFLEEIAAATDIGKVHLVAHSLGAEVLGHAMVKLGVADLGVRRRDGSFHPRFRQIVFAAPDLTPEIFTEYIEPAIRTNHVVTASGATVDIPLWFSALRSGRTRSGVTRRLRP